MMEGITIIVLEEILMANGLTVLMMWFLLFCRRKNRESLHVGDKIYDGIAIVNLVGALSETIAFLVDGKGLLQTGGVAFQVDAHKALVLGTVLVQPRQTQRVITDVVLVVGLLGRFQRAGEVGRQGIVQPGLCLFGGLCG